MFVFSDVYFALSIEHSISIYCSLLTLWFDYGQNADVYDTLIDGIKTVRIETWLQVIPQLIARIDTPRQLVSHLIMQLLMDVGKDHPQVSNLSSGFFEESSQIENTEKIARKFNKILI